MILQVVHFIKYLLPLSALLHEATPKRSNSLLSHRLCHKSSLRHHPLPILKLLKIPIHFLVFLHFFPSWHSSRFCLLSISLPSLLVAPILLIISILPFYLLSTIPWLFQSFLLSSVSLSFCWFFTLSSPVSSSPLNVSLHIFTLVYSHLNNLLFEEVHVWLVGCVRVQAVVVPVPGHLSQVPGLPMFWGNSPGFCARHRHDDDEQEREEGQGQHQGISEHFPLQAAHDDWTMTERLMRDIKLDTDLRAVKVLTITLISWPDL